MGFRWVQPGPASPFSTCEITSWFGALLSTAENFNSSQGLCHPVGERILGMWQRGYNKECLRIGDYRGIAISHDSGGEAL